jgi:hypothetical protein
MMGMAQMVLAQTSQAASMMLEVGLPALPLLRSTSNW